MQKSLSFGIVGIGHFGKHYVRLVQESGFALSAVCSKTQKSIQELKTPKNTIKTTNYLDVLKNNSIDCVIIATPPQTHFEIALNALKFGKNVLLEKPMTVNLMQAKVLAKAVKKSGCTFMVGHQYVYNDYINFLKKEIESKRFEKIKSMSAQHYFFAQKKTDVSCLWDAGTHQLAVLHYLCGGSKISKVSGKAFGFENGFDDFAAVLVEFENGLVADLVVCRNANFRLRKFVFFAQKKSAVFDEGQTDQKLKFFLENNKTFMPKISAKEPLKNQLGHFVQCIKTKKEPLTGIKSSVEITKWLDKISRKIDLPKYP